MAGANKPDPIEIIGGDGKTYVVDTWNRGTIADGKVMSDYTIRPICEAIQAGTSGLSAEIDRAIKAEQEISAVVSSHYDEYSAFVHDEYSSFKESVIISAAESLRYDNYLSGQIDTLKAATDVIMVYGDYSAFTTNSGELLLTDADVIKVLVDEYTNDKQVYYQWYDPASGHDWTGWSAIGSLDPYYSISEIDEKERTLSSTIANNYLSASTAAVCSGHNIVVTKDSNHPKITIATKNEVDFDKVSATIAYGSSAKFDNISAVNFESQFGTIDAWKLNFVSAIGDNLTASNTTVINLTASTLNDTNVNSLIGSAQSGAEASAYITAHSADFLNSAHNAYGTLTFGTKAYPATNSNYNFTILAGQGIGFTTANNQVTISAEGTTYQASSYISTADKKISVTGSLITSAKAGSAASAWINNTLFDYSFTDSVDTKSTAGSIDKIKILYKNDVTDHDVMHNQELVFSRGNYSVSGLLIQAANSNDNGKVLTYNSTANNYTWQAIPPTTYSNDDCYISINNTTRKIGLATTGIKTSAYSAEFIDGYDYYNSVLNGQSIRFSHGFQGLDISLTGVYYYTQSTHSSTNWDNLFQNYAQVNRDKITGTNLTADKVNFIVASGSSGAQPYKAVNFVVTSTLPSVLTSGTYYIV